MHTSVHVHVSEQIPSNWSHGVMKARVWGAGEGDACQSRDCFTWQRRGWITLGFMLHSYLLKDNIGRCHKSLTSNVEVACHNAN